MKLDKSKPYGQIIGSTDGSRFEQGGFVFDHEGNEIVQEGANIATTDEAQSEQPKKRGRPSKVIE